MLLSIGNTLRKQDGFGHSGGLVIDVAYAGAREGLSQNPVIISYFLFSL